VTLYAKYLKLREELSRHKWIESEKAGKDIGIEETLIDWFPKHRKNWLDNLEKEIKKHDSRT
jgi:hypothetical protein